MTVSALFFRDFEHVGWGDPSLCERYDALLSTVTVQCISALLDAAGVRAGANVLDVATGAGYVASAAAERGAKALGVDFSAAQVALARCMPQSRRMGQWMWDFPLGRASFCSAIPTAVRRACGAPVL